MKFKKSHWRFTKPQRIGIFLFLFLIGVTQFIFTKINQWENKPIQFKKELLFNPNNENLYTKELKNPQKTELKPFNPNTISQKEWQKLGFSEKQVAVIFKYKNSLGGFSSKDEIKNCFVISNEKYLELAPYISLPDKPGKKNKKFSYDSPKSEGGFKLRNLKPFDPNAYNQEQWQSFGFSEKQAQVIIKYKYRLGGQFNSKEQIKECFVIDDNAYNQLEPYIKLSQTTTSESKISSSEIPEKFNPNDLTEEQWQSLGFSPKQVKVIFNYKRSLGGKFTSLDQISRCYVISEKKFNELSPRMEIR